MSLTIICQVLAIDAAHHDLQGARRRAELGSAVEQRVPAAHPGLRIGGQLVPDTLEVGLGVQQAGVHKLSRLRESMSRWAREAAGADVAGATFSEDAAAVVAVASAVVDAVVPVALAFRPPKPPPPSPQPAVPSARRLAAPAQKRRRSSEISLSLSFWWSGMCCVRSACAGLKGTISNIYARQPRWGSRRALALETGSGCAAKCQSPDRQKATFSVT